MGGNGIVELAIKIVEPDCFDNKAKIIKLYLNGKTCFMTAVELVSKHDGVRVCLYHRCCGESLDQQNKHHDTLHQNDPAFHFPKSTKIFHSLLLLNQITWSWKVRVRVLHR